MRESHIERTVCDYARRRGFLTWKLRIVNVAGVPDRMLLRDGRVLFIEFKAPGKKPTPLQERVHGLLRRYRFQVEVVDDVARGKAVVDAFA